MCMIKLFSSLEKFLPAVSIITVLMLFVVPMTFGELILLENFEEDPVDWPWSTNEDQEWVIRPDPPGVGANHTWGIDSTVYHPDGNPNHLQSIWCASLPNDLIPGNDTYPENMDAWTAWGPFDISEEDIDVGGVFHCFGNKEPYWEGAGDNFAVLVTDNFDNIDNREYDNCCIAYQLIGEEIDGVWAPVEFDLAEMDSAGVEVSYLPFQDENGRWQTRSDVWIAFVFQSNNTEDEDNLGMFVDDFGLASYDGLFDFEMSDLNYQDPEDSSDYSGIHAADPIQFELNFNTIGPAPEDDAYHILYIDTDLEDENDVWAQPFDTVSGTWESTRWGVFHTEYFVRTWVPAAEDTGLVVIAVKLDANEEIDESSEDNNVLVDTILVNQGQTPPTMVWIRPSSPEDTVFVSDSTSVTILFEAYNSPDDEYAEISFFYDTQPGSFTGIRINSGSYKEILNGGDSFTWDMSDLEIGEYWLYAEMNDQYYFGITSHAAAPIVFQYDAVENKDILNIPSEFEIVEIYPNPFNPTVEISIAVPTISDIQADWYAVDGRLVDSKALSAVQPGIRKMNWTPNHLSSGIYYLNLSTEAGKATAKVIYMK
ncbi:MAG: T9SS type A sorting domain-containing protein [Candidatus Electryonea clarkiae]|nr:T9SS type A sorting domain-containing protein [Candidatus Electryonea clarkiae]MDP8288433.1 T9SS type A sorting domain-containing protein [Candidatus Electryonea clarkiae]